MIYVKGQVLLCSFSLDFFTYYLHRNRSIGFKFLDCHIPMIVEINLFKFSLCLNDGLSWIYNATLLTWTGMLLKHVH